MVGRALGALEAAVGTAALAAIVYYSTGADPQMTTAPMVGLVTVVWLTYRIALFLWVRERSWMGAPWISGGDIPHELKAGIDRVEASIVEFGGRRWRTASAAMEVGADGASVTALRPPALLATGQGVLVSLGLIGTFFGLTLGLTDALPNLIDRRGDGAAQTTPTSGAAVAGVPAEDAGKDGSSDNETEIEKMQGGMEALLGGAQLAFAKSLAGVAFAMLWGLRLRHAESRRDEYLDGLAHDLDGRWPLLTSQHLQLHAASEIARTNGILADLAAGVAAEQGRAEVRAEELKATVGKVGKTVEERANELVMTMQGLSESLPAAIGVRPGQNFLELLAPQFALLVGEMKKLTEGGNQQISDAMLGKADAEVSSLKRALSDIVDTLDRLPGDYRTHMGEVQAGVQGAMNAVGQTVSTATADLTGVSGDLRAVIGEIGRILPEVKTAASALRGAGEDVRAGLDGVATPLLGLPPALDATRAALEGAAGALAASESALLRHSESARALNDAVGAQERAAAGAAERAGALVEQIDRLRIALGASESRLGDLTAAQAAANGQAVAELGQSLNAFQGALEGVQRSMEASSEGALRKAEGVSLEAAQRVAQALGKGAGEFETAMQRLTAHSSAMENSLKAARDTADALVGHAATLRDGVSEVARPLGPIATALNAVPAGVQAAAQALRTEHTALQSLGAQLKEQAATVRGEQEALGQRINDYKQLNTLLAREMAAHLQGITGANEQVRAAWAEATGKSREVVEATAQQLGAYAQQVEQALRLPGDLRRLDQTIVELSDVLDALRTALAERANDLEPDDTDA